MNAFPKWVVTLFIVAIVIVAIWYFSSIVICLLLAGLFSLIFKPIYDFFKRIKFRKKNISNGIAAALTLATVLTFVLLFVASVVPMVIHQVSMVSKINLSNVMLDLQQPIQQVETLLNKLGVINSDKSIEDFLTEKIKQLIIIIDIPSMATNFFSGAGNFFFIFFSTIFMLFFFLKEENLFHRLIAIFIPDEQEPKLENTFTNVRNMLFRYFFGILIQVSCIALYVTTLLYFFGIENAFLIGLLAGILNVVPYIGPVFGVIVAVSLTTIAHLQSGTYYDLPYIFLKILGVFVSMQFLDNNFLTPYIFSKSTNAHPLEIFIVILLAASLVGIAGMIVAVPVYTIIRIIVFEFFGENELIKKLRAL
jgi:predicted PurR-regulated permease PerM